MFTFGAIALTTFLAWYSGKANEDDRKFDSSDNDRFRREMLLHIRQDLKTIIFLIGGVMIMLGLIADRL